LAQEGFWGSIREAVTVGVLLMASGELIAEAKVCSFYIQLSVTKKVLWLQVPVDDTILVALLHSGY